jgi:asparagine synthase (glutamine-hydrolysing)
VSGLVALVNHSGAPIEERALWNILRAAPHRGPDGAWVHVDGAAGLGYAKLAVTPEDVAARQPLASPLTGCVVTADARLDNRAELLAVLRGDWLRGADAEVPDAALILRAYEVWGGGAARRLLGDFAFVVWDPRARRLVCARDTSGQRPLFYRADRQTFAAASEIRQLLQDPSVAVTPSEERLLDFLVPANLWVNEKDCADTFFVGIRAVPAGHTLTLGVGEGESVPRIERYWALEPPAEIRYRTEEEYAEHFRALFFEAVRARLRSAGDVGMLLSGGLDSSSVACVAQELYRTGRAARGVTAYSMVFEGLECDERPLVEDVRAKSGLPVEFVPAPVGLWGAHLEPSELLTSPLDRPDARWALYAQAERRGLRVVLTGDIADGCVRGSPLVFDALLRRGRWRELRRHLAAYRAWSDDGLRRIAALYCAAPLLPLGAQRAVMAAWQRRAILRDRRLLPAWLTEPVRAELGRRHLEISLERERSRRFSSPAREEEYRLLYPPEVARTPAGSPVETWRPVAERRLHEFLLAVPPELKYAPHQDTNDAYAAGKRLPRMALRGLLPESIRTRTYQTHFAAVFERELETHWPALEATFGPGGTPEVARRGYVEAAPFWDRLCQVRAGYRPRDFMYVLRLVEVEMWLRSFSAPRTAFPGGAGTWGTSAEASEIPGTTQDQHFRHGSARVPA